MQICVIGTGYVGLVTGACLAELDHQVVCVDNDLAKVKRLNLGDVNIYEPGLSEMVIDNMRKKRLEFTSDVADAIKNASVIFICVNTPEAGDGSADLTQVYTVAKSIGEHMNSDKYIVVKSTVPVGTTAKLAKYISLIQEEKNTGFKCTFAFNPEFLKEGTAVNDFMEPDRIIIGADDEATFQLTNKLYEPIVNKRGCNLLNMDLQSAELSKYAANCMLATRISFVNELAKLCELTGADITQVAKGIGSDRRIGPHFLKAGLGYGGSCFPKDVKSLVVTFSEYGLNAELLKAVDQINQSQRKYFVNKIKNYFAPQLDGKILAVWGLTFKPETDDLREAPSLTIIEELLNLGVEVKVFDPQGMKNIPQVVGECAAAKQKFCQEQYQAVEAADALLIITEWECFHQPDFTKLKQLLKRPVIFDGRNIYEPETVRQAGFEYYGIGRSSKNP